MSAVNADCAAARSETSNGRARACRPCPRTADKVPSRQAAVRACTTISKPSRARRSAMAAPMPRLDPVTSIHSVIDRCLEERCQIGRRKTLELRLGEPLGAPLDRAIEYTYALPVPQDEFCNDGEIDACGKVRRMRHEAARSEQQSDARSIAIGAQLESRECGYGLCHQFDSDPTGNPPGPDERMVRPKSRHDLDPLVVTVDDTIDQQHVASLQHELRDRRLCARRQATGLICKGHRVSLTLAAEFRERPEALRGARSRVGIGGIPSVACEHGADPAPCERVCAFEKDDVLQVAVIPGTDEGAKRLDSVHEGLAEADIPVDRLSLQLPGDGGGGEIRRLHRDRDAGGKNRIEKLGGIAKQGEMPAMEFADACGVADYLPDLSDGFGVRQ